MEVDLHNIGMTRREQMRNSFYDDRDYDPGDEMLSVASQCSHFPEGVILIHLI